MDLSIPYHPTPKINTRMNFKKYIAAALMICCALGEATVAQTDLESQPEKKQTAGRVAKDIVKLKLGQTENAFQVAREIAVGGQTEEAGFSQIKEAGYKRVLNLYPRKTQSFDEKQACKRLGLKYQNLPFENEKQLNDEVFNQVRISLLDSKNYPVFMHGKTNDEVATVWAAYRTLDQGVRLETAIKEAKAIGMKTAGYEQKLRQYVARMLGGSISGAVAAIQPVSGFPTNHSYPRTGVGANIYQPSPIFMPVPT